MVRTFDEIISAVKLREKKNIAIAAAADTAVLEAVMAVEDDLGIANCLLIGDKEGILKTAEKLNYNVKRENIIDVKSDAEAAVTAVKMVNSGEAHMPMKGQMQTPDYLRPILNKENGLRKGNGALCHVGIFEKPDGGLFLLTDAAMTMFPDINQKIDLIKNAVLLCFKVFNHIFIYNIYTWFTGFDQSRAANKSIKILKIIFFLISPLSNVTTSDIILFPYGFKFFHLIK
jgi:phosphate butyryltransferase